MKLFDLRWVSAGILLLLPSFASVHAVTTGNLLVANEGVVYEYTPNGAFVQTVTPDLRNGVFSESRGIAYDRFGRIHVLIRPHDGDDPMFLATYDPGTALTQYNEIAFHNHNGNTTYGDIGADANYVYAPDQVFALQSQGVVRYPLTDLSSPELVLTDLSPTDVSVGYDGRLYVQSSNGGDIYVYNPDTLALINSFSTVNDMRDVAVTADGSIFAIYNDQVLRRYDQSGVLQDSLELPSGANHSMALSPDGVIVVGSSGNNIYITDTDLNAVATVATPASTEDNWGNFVTFAVAVPEPSSLALLGLGGLLLARRRRDTGRIRIVCQQQHHQ
jgi:outer membrane protein assembly factor BamB